jgi:quercetin dioxygenase-like cupin family protein
MKRTGIAVSLALAGALAYCGAALAQEHAAHQFAHAKDLKWSDTPALPGAKLAVIEGPLNEAKPFTMRLKFPANYKIPPHFHSAIEHVTVISGEFGMGMGEKLDESKVTRLQPGDVAIMQPKTAHYGVISKPTELQVHGVGPWTVTFVNAADDPRKK